MQVLDSVVSTDVCIVGAGYSGMTTALELLKTGTSTVILEAKEPGFGGSGRNAGHCTPTFTHYTLSHLRRMLGEPYADRLIQRQTRANDTVSRLIRDNQIDCEWQQNGYFRGALVPDHFRDIDDLVESYNAVGARTRRLTAAEAETVTGTDRYLGGWLHEEGGHLNPLGYARGLARTVINQGGQIYRNSAVAGCKREGAKWRVETAQGAVLADKVIFTTGAYTLGGWPRLEDTFKILRVFVCATQPLSEETRKHLMPQNTTMHDGRGDIYVYKYNREGRIVASMFPMDRRGRDLDYTKALMTDRLKWLHPSVKEDLRWEFFWWGELDMQRKTIPRLYGLAPGVAALTGLSGRGVPTGTMLGGILSEWALDVPDAELSLPVEKLAAAPRYMSVAPALSLRYYRYKERQLARKAGQPLPPHA